MDKPFHLDIVQHPETRLYQSWGMAPQHSWQILLLFEHIYVIQRQYGELTAVNTVEDPVWLEKIQQQKKLSPEELQQIEQIYHPAALSASNDTSSPGSLLTSPLSATAHALSAYAPQSTTGAAVPPSTRNPTLQQLDAEPLEEKTRPLIEQALEIAQEQQQTLLKQAAELQGHIQKQQLQLQHQLRQVPQLEQELELLNQKLEEWQLVMEAEHHHQEALIHNTQQELQSIQDQLQETLSSGMALQHHLRSRRLPEDHQLQQKLNYLEEMIDHVLAQRHSVHYILQQKSYQHLENQRFDILKARYESVRKAHQDLQAQISQLETINRDILLQDPLAVPEPVPMMALHELQRLQFEKDLLEADPRLQAHFKSQKAVVS
jgi:hypothetical protein